jgi:predicted nucleotidyltransferase
MLRDQVLRTIAANDAELRALGVARLLLFGSVARGEDRADSDIDLLVEFDGRPVGYFHLFRVQRRLEELLGRKVDLGTIASLRSEFRDEVFAEAVRAA